MICRSSNRIGGWVLLVRLKGSPLMNGSIAAVLAEGIYIGGGVLVVILIILLILYMMRRA